MKKLNIVLVILFIVMLIVFIVIIVNKNKTIKEHKETIVDNIKIHNMWLDGYVGGYSEDPGDSGSMGG